MIETLLGEPHWANFESEFLVILKRKSIKDICFLESDKTLEEKMKYGSDLLIQKSLSFYSFEKEMVSDLSGFIVFPVEELVPLIDLNLLRAFILQNIQIFVYLKEDYLKEQDVRKLWYHLKEVQCD